MDLNPSTKSKLSIHIGNYKKQMGFFFSFLSDLADYTLFKQGFALRHRGVLGKMLN